MTEFQDGTLITMRVMGCQVQAIGEAIRPKSGQSVLLVFFCFFRKNHKDIPKKTSEVKACANYAGIILNIIGKQRH